MRHGETDWNKERKFQGQSDIPLNECGKEIAGLTKEGLKEIEFQQIFASPLCRTRETASIVADDRKQEVQIDKRLIEIGFGIGEGACVFDVNDNKEHPLYHFLHCPEKFQPLEGGESLAEVQARCLSFIQEVLVPLETTTENVLLVSHGAFIRVLITYVQGDDYAQLWKGDIHKNCAITSFEMINGKLSLLEEGKLYYENR